MKSVYGLALVVVAAAAVSWQADAQGLPQGSAGGGAELITHFLPVEGQATQLTLVDPTRRVLAVYHIARDTGAVQLRSVRNIDGDLQLDEYNGAAPFPKDIRNQLQRAPQ